MKHFKELLTLIPFILGIGILLNLFVYQTMEVIYPAINYEDYCGEMNRVIEPARELDQAFTELEIQEFANQCVAGGGKYEESFRGNELGYCNQNFTCNQEREAAEKDRALVMLIVLILTGTASLIASRQFGNKAVELGLSYGGLFMLLSSLGQLWQVGSQAVQLIGIVLALGGLIYFSSRFIKDEE